MKKVYNFTYGENNTVTPKNYKEIKSFKHFRIEFDGEVKECANSLNKSIPEFNEETDILMQFDARYKTNKKSIRKRYIFSDIANVKSECFGGNISLKYRDDGFHAATDNFPFSLICDFMEIAEIYRSVTGRNDIFYGVDGYLKFYQKNRKQPITKKLKSFVPKNLIRKIKQQPQSRTDIEFPDYYVSASRIKFLLRFKSKYEKAKFKLMLWNILSYPP